VLLNHAPSAVSYTFDEDNLIASVGLVPLLRLAKSAALMDLAQGRLSVPTDKGANAGAKVASLVAGMASGADSIDDMDLLRHGGMASLFARVYAPSTLGSFLRKFTFGHVKQLDAIAARFLANLGQGAALLEVTGDAGAESMIFVDIDDTVIEVYSAAKQGAGIGYQGSRGLNALLATASTACSTPIIIGQRLRKGATHSARGAEKFLADALATLARTPGGAGGQVVVRADSAYYAAKVAKAARTVGADLSVVVPMNKAVKTAIATIDEENWQGIKYPQAIFDEDSGQWISEAEVAEVAFTAFSSRPKGEQVTGRLIVRRVPEKNQAKVAATGQDSLFTAYRHHAFFTTIDPSVLDTVAADKAHRQHAVIEQINAELKDGPLAHMPSSVFAANGAWLVLAAITHNLLRAAAVLSGGRLARARAATVRRKIIDIPARIAHRARRLILHLPTEWKWAAEFERLWHSALSPPLAAASP